MPDKYDEAIAYLKERNFDPVLIYNIWNEATCTVNKGKVPYCLFDTCEKTPSSIFEVYGCLTEVKSGIRNAETPELTSMIRRDDRIPSRPKDINETNIEVFAELQRFMDNYFNR